MSPFSVEADTDVDLRFDSGATFGDVTTTGHGKVMLSPVNRSREMQ